MALKTGKFFVCAAENAGYAIGGLSFSLALYNLAYTAGRLRYSRRYFREEPSANKAIRVIYIAKDWRIMRPSFYSEL